VLLLEVVLLRCLRSEVGDVLAGELDGDVRVHGRLLQT
jgi:hypothetical protein